MKILNLYCGIGGNRKLWGDNHKVTAIEYDERIANIYSDHFPKDNMVVGDAHEYLLKNFENFDFIWSSPPCPTHSRARKALAWKTKKDGTKYRQNDPVYPDMKLYQEILLLQHYFNGDWIVENVISFYNPLIKPQKIGKHFFWSNLKFDDFKEGTRGHDSNIEALQDIKGFDLSKYCGIDKRKVLRNCVNYKLGKHLFEKIETSQNKDYE